jgi:hypothetical protein
MTPLAVHAGTLLHANRICTVKFHALAPAVDLRSRCAFILSGLHCARRLAGAVLFVALAVLPHADVVWVRAKSPDRSRDNVLGVFRAVVGDACSRGAIVLRASV